MGVWGNVFYSTSSGRDNYMEQTKLKEEMAKLKAKWPTPPVKFTKEWWRYRADRCLWLTYKQKLNSPIFETAKKLFE